MVSEYRLIQDGQSVAWVDGPDENALREIRHYAAIYSHGEPVKIQFKTRGGWWVNLKTAPQQGEARKMSEPLEYWAESLAIALVRNRIRRL